jgi:hypothetical protein
MAVNRVYKGDLVEVSLAKETGFRATGNNGATGWATANGTTANSSVITIGSAVYFDDLMAKNMLVGGTLRIYSSGGSNSFTSDDFPSTKRTYYITANTENTITISPRLATTGAITANTGDYFIIDSARIPTMDADMTHTTDERVKADQFLGLLNSFALPEPEVDVRKQHIVGMGRDVNILTSGREMLQGGSFDTNAHSLRWLRYALGGHSAIGFGELAHRTTSTTILTDAPLNIKDATATYRGREYGQALSDADDISAVSGTTCTGLGTNVGANSDFLLGAKTALGSSPTINLDTSDYDATHENVGTAGVFKVLSSDGTDILYGSYTGASGTALTGADITTGALTEALKDDNVIYLLAQLEANIEEGDIRVNLGSTIAGRFTAGEYIQIVDKDTKQIPGADDELPTINKHEIRRVIAVDGAFVYVEEPFFFAHTAASCGADRIIFTYDSTQGATRRGSPAILSTGELKYGITHTFFGGSTVPTFAIEQSYRKTDATPGSENLLRVFSGCKVNSIQFSADTEGEVKLSGEYEATRMFTDTEDRFTTPHRLFENTANTNIKRRVSGIAVNGEKPYLFQHIIFSAFGAPVLRATQLEFGIANTNTARYYIRGTDGSYGTTDQVSEAAVNYATEITEAQREYNVKFNALVEDNHFFEQLRQRKHFLNTNDITIVITKPGSASTRQNATITIEDYTVTKAEMPIPDDKGPVTANVELAVRHLKVVETNPYPIL